MNRYTSIFLKIVRDKSSQILEGQQVSVGGAGFDHNRAQEYELENESLYIKGYFKKIYDDVLVAKKSRNIYFQGTMNEFYKNESKEVWQKDAQSWVNKNNLEIGCGPVGSLLQWFWLKNVKVIDPLALEYKNCQLKEFKKTLFWPSVKIYSIKAEKYIPALKSSIDGVIMLRNALDHLEDPMKVMENTARYAKKGCTLLFWSDLWHLKGHDEGHNNITQSIPAFKALISGLGFKIIRDVPNVREGNDTIEYGCRALKL